MGNSTSNIIDLVNSTVFVDIIIGCIIFSSYLFVNQIDALAVHFPSLFKIPVQWISIYLSKSYTMRTLFIIIGSLIQHFFVTFISSSIVPTTLISFLLVLMIRLIHVISLYNPLNALKTYIILNIEALFFGFFQMSVLTTMIQSATITMLSVAVSGSTAFLIQRALNYYYYDNPLLMVKIHSWIGVIMTVVSFAGLNCYLNYYFRYPQSYQTIVDRVKSAVETFNSIITEIKADTNAKFYNITRLTMLDNETMSLFDEVIRIKKIKGMSNEADIMLKIIMEIRDRTGRIQESLEFGKKIGTKNVYDIKVPLRNGIYTELDYCRHLKRAWDATKAYFDVAKYIYIHKYKDPIKYESSKYGKQKPIKGIERTASQKKIEANTAPTTRESKTTSEPQLKHKAPVSVESRTQKLETATEGASTAEPSSTAIQVENGESRDEVTQSENGKVEQESTRDTKEREREHEGSGPEEEEATSLPTTGEQKVTASSSSFTQTTESDSTSVKPSTKPNIQPESKTKTYIPPVTTQKYAEKTKPQTIEEEVSDSDSEPSKDHFKEKTRKITVELDSLKEEIMKVSLSVKKQYMIENERNEVKNMIHDVESKIIDMDSRFIEVERILYDKIRYEYRIGDDNLKHIELVSDNQTKILMENKKLMKNIFEENKRYNLSPYLMFFVTTFFTNSIFPRILPTAFSQVEGNDMVVIVIVVSLYGPLMILILDRIANDFKMWRYGYNVLWIILVPILLGFVYTMVALHTNIRFVRGVFNTDGHVILITIGFLSFHYIMKCVSLVGISNYVCYQSGDVSGNVKYFTYYHILTLLFHFLICKLSIKTNARLTLGYPFRNLPIQVHPGSGSFLFWLKDGFRSSFKELLGDIMGNIRRYV